MDASVRLPARHDSAVGKPLPHDSAHLHVTGLAAYIDDLPEPRDLLHLAVGMSEVAHARVTSIDLAQVRAVSGVVDVCVAEDITGVNNYGAIVAD
ncbi:MAG: xanthine dehydrogenase molybdopterin binding subunit, partial [Proteobacteria bacterium]|nr:xanthine dehydrogenase molybdopterin binding subunit [Pseudomonadota bacterium]